MKSSSADMDARLAKVKRERPELFSAPVSIRVRNRSVMLAGLALLVFGLWWVDASPWRLAGGISRLGFLVKLMVPPDSGGALAVYMRALFETISMAFLGTALAVIIAFPIGFLAARNILRNAPAHFMLRRVLDCFRGIDTLIWALVFVSAVGMGPFAGVLAIATSEIAFLSKIFAEAIENVDMRPLEGCRAAGGNTIQVVRLAVVPQILPMVVGNTLFFFEANVRAGTVLGIVGAGGIGTQLTQRIFINSWDQACFIIILILMSVAVIDTISAHVRKRLISGQPA